MSDLRSRWIVDTFDFAHVFTYVKIRSSHDAAQMMLFHDHDHWIIYQKKMRCASLTGLKKYW